MTAFVNLRNTVSKQVTEYSPEDAERILAHPVWGKVNEVVRTAKPEVLSAEKTDPQRSKTSEAKETNDKEEADK